MDMVPVFLYCLCARTGTRISVGLDVPYRLAIRPRTAVALCVKAASRLVGRRVSGLMKIMIYTHGSMVLTHVKQLYARPMFSGRKPKQLRNIKQGVARVRLGIGGSAWQCLWVERTEEEEGRRVWECPVAHDKPMCTHWVVWSPSASHMSAEVVPHVSSPAPGECYFESSVATKFSQ